jgi:excisionase family DNA binding protein
MDDKRQSVSFMPLEPTAIRLGLPKRYLRELADAGDIPCLRVGRRRLFNPTDVAEALRGKCGGPR